MEKSNSKNKAFSKSLLVQESVLIWILTLSCIYLAYYSIVHDYNGSLPWLTAMVSLPWAAYGISQAFYYKKSLAENTKNGIKYDSIMTELNNSLNTIIDSQDTITPIVPEEENNYSGSNGALDPFGQI